MSNDDFEVGHGWAATTTLRITRYRCRIPAISLTVELLLSSSSHNGFLFRALNEFSAASAAANGVSVSKSSSLLNDFRFSRGFSTAPSSDQVKFGVFWNCVPFV